MADSGHSVMTVQDILELHCLRDAGTTVAAAGHRLRNPVEWVHVFETTDVSDVLRGGEFLLTTGIGLAGMPPAAVDALIAAIARAGGAGIGLEPTHVAAATLAAPCAAHDLPLLVFGRPVRFVEITHEVHERLVSGELLTLRRAISLQRQLRAAAREGLGPGGLVVALSDVLEAQVLLERRDRRPIASAPQDGLDTAFLDALDRHRQRLPTALVTRPVGTAARLHVLSRRGDELDTLAVDEAALLLEVALASQPPADEVPSAERAQLLHRLADGRAGSARDVQRRARSVGIDLSRATLVAFHAQGSLERLAALAPEAALVDGPRGLLAVRRGADPWAIARDLVRRGAATAVGIDSRGSEPGQLRDAMAGARRACLVAAAAGPPVRHGSQLGALEPVAEAALSGRPAVPRLDPAALRTIDALVRTGWSKAAAARRLGVARQRVYERLAAIASRYGLDPDLPQTRVELALELWAVRMGELARPSG